MAKQFRLGSRTDYAKTLRRKEAPDCGFKNPKSIRRINEFVNSKTKAQKAIF